MSKKLTIAWTDEMMDALNAFDLEVGCHTIKEVEHGRGCIMEAFGFVTRGLTTDQPPCVSEVIAGRMRALNDTNRARQRELITLAPFIINTAPVKRVRMGGLRRSAVVLAPTPEYYQIERARSTMLGISLDFETNLTLIKEAANLGRF